MSIVSAEIGWTLLRRLRMNSNSCEGGIAFLIDELDMEGIFLQEISVYA
jgi:hypothetical protein